MSFADNAFILPGFQLSFQYFFQLLDRGLLPVKGNRLVLGNFNGQTFLL